MMLFCSPSSSVSSGLPILFGLQIQRNCFEFQLDTSFQAWEQEEEEEEGQEEVEQAEEGGDCAMSPSVYG